MNIYSRYANCLIYSLFLSLAITSCSSLPSQMSELESESATASSSNFEVLQSYTLDEGDLIEIQVFDEPDLTMNTRIGASGSINYSYLGDVLVRGKTSVELEEQITSLLRGGYLVNPSVNVTILEYRPFYIGGEVRSPGSYNFEPGLTLDKAIALAGGLTDRASVRRIYIAKQSSDQVKAALTTMISPGDVITVKEGFF